MQSGELNIIKLIDWTHLRVWIMPVSMGWYIHRKAFKACGYVIFMGRLRISITFRDSDMVWFNPITLQTSRTLPTGVA